MSKTLNSTTDPTTPDLCLFWINLQSRLPVINLLGNGTSGSFNISLTIVTFLFFSIVRGIVEYILVRFFQWPAGQLATKMASSSCVSIFHSTNLVAVLYLLLKRTITPKWYYNPSSRMVDDAIEMGQWWTDCVGAMLQFCTGYMLFDGIITVVYYKTVLQPGGINSEDLMFLGHHVATTLYMSSTRFYQAGHQSAMMCMFLGELTNPLHNGYYIATYATELGLLSTSSTTYTTIQFLFGLLYVIIRSVASTIGIVHATYNLIAVGMRHVKELPNAMILVWILLMWAVLVGSIPWVIECYTFVLKPLPQPVAEVLISIFGGGEVTNSQRLVDSEL